MNMIPQEDQRRIQLNLLKYFSQICEEHRFRYYVIDGTLLGTIRHKGYIPWDDDIDVAMPRADYDRFLKEFSKINSNESMKLISRDTNPLYHLAFAKLYDGTTTLRERRVRKKFQFLYGIYIDIFPLDSVPSDPKARKRFVMRNYYLSKTISMNVIGLEVPHKSWVGKALYTTLYYLQKPFPIKQLTKLQEKWIKGCDEKNRGSGLIKELAFQDANAELYFFEEDFRECVEMPFENLMVRVPKGYDRILTNTYGDYMQLPPESERINHGIEAYTI